MDNNLRPHGVRLQGSRHRPCHRRDGLFAQFELNVPCVAMVTASHNDNGWTARWPTLTWRRVRQRHGRRLRTENSPGDRLRGRAARLQSRSHVSTLQSEHRRHEDAARDARCGPRQPGRRRARLRGEVTAAAWWTTRVRKSSPTRWRHAGARHFQDDTEHDVRSRREVTGLYKLTRC